MLTKNKEQFTEELQFYRRRGVPIVAIEGSLDQQSTLEVLTGEVATAETCVFDWNWAKGLRVSACAHDDGCQHKVQASNMMRKAQGGDEEEFFLNAISALEACEIIIKESRKLDVPVMFIFRQADRLITQYNDSIWALVQLINDMRDPLKRNRGTLYLVGQSFQLPRELKENVLSINEPLPNEEERKVVIDKSIEAYKEMAERESDITPKKYGKKEIYTISEAIKGGSLFSSEQALSLSIEREGLNLDKIRDKKIQLINSINGLRVSKPTGKGFDALGGFSNLKSYCKRMMDNKLQSSVVVKLDELEKMIGGATGGAGDSSGVAQAFLGTLLTFIEETKSLGMMYTGVYGCGKSAFTRSLAEEMDAIGIEMNLNSMKGSLVGESEANLNTALSTCANIAGDVPILFVATCNRPDFLPPEFKRRFNLGTFFFCFPTAEERTIIWKIYLARYDLKDKVDFDDTRWTGADIENCCRQAYLMGASLSEAKEYITPIARTANTEINQLMAQAHDRFLSTSQPGMFNKDTWEADDKPSGKRGRDMRL